MEHFGESTRHITGVGVQISNGGRDSLVEEELESIKIQLDHLTKEVSDNHLDRIVAKIIFDSGLRCATS